MKKHLLLYVLFYVLISCNKDSCKDSICLNGGNCVNGICQCAPGYSGTHCDEYDLCYKVVCPGKCELGECLPPKKAMISKIEVIRFPGVRPTGFPWDGAMPPDNSPDIFPHVLQDSLVIWASQMVQPNAIPNTVYSFMLTQPLVISNPASQYFIGLMDSDAPQPPEPMDAKLSFNPLLSSSGFPPNLTVDAGGPTAFRLTINYEW